MELLARERAAEKNVQLHLNSTEHPLANLLKAFAEYREAALASIFSDFENTALQKGQVLWHTHTEGRKYLSSALNRYRKEPSEHAVAARHLTKAYLVFIKDSQRFYREYIFQLNTRFGGIRELEVVAHQVKIDASGESSHAPLKPSLRQLLLRCCHQALICLGDLSRYRASDKLDKNPDFGPAIGYYDLACTVLPSSGMGHGQLSIVALAQGHHLRAIYHLYRAIVVDHPHPNAPGNLKTEFDKTNAAWDKGELIKRGPPSDPEVSKSILLGWFVRLHSMCFSGEPFKGFSELESEVLGKLAAEIKLRPLGNTLMKMVLVNLAAQYTATEKFKRNPIQQNSNAFCQFFRINIKTFTTLLRTFHQELSSVNVTTVQGDDEIELSAWLNDVSRRNLPAIRIYSHWLLTMSELAAGLTCEESLKEPIDQFWRQYARTVDLIAAIFPIWDLEELDEITYLLEEDADTVGFQPLVDERTTAVWYHKKDNTEKPRFSDQGIVRATEDLEMLGRVRDFLTDGLFLANDDEHAPIKLRGTRILHRDAEDVEVLPVTVPKESIKPKQPAAHAPVAKAMSYASAAASGMKQTAKVSSLPNGASHESDNIAQDAQLSRMVDDLVDDDEHKDPVTPPQSHASHPAVVTRGDVSYSARSGGARDFAHLPVYSGPAKQMPIGTPATKMSPQVTTPKTISEGTPTNRMQSVQSLWEGSPGQNMSSFPSGLPTGTLASPAQLHSTSHSRVNSASSIRSGTSRNGNMGFVDAWTTVDSATRSKNVTPKAGLSNGVRAFDSHVASPLLFGAGGGMWSATGGRRATPPSGQGG